MAPKTKRNPRGGGRKPRTIPGRPLTVIVDADLHDQLDTAFGEGYVKSQIVNTALRDFFAKFIYLSKKTKK
jgi:hypothetical protein